MFQFINAILEQFLPCFNRMGRIGATPLPLKLFKPRIGRRRYYRVRVGVAVSDDIYFLFHTCLF